MFYDISKSRLNARIEGFIKNVLNEKHPSYPEILPGLKIKRNVTVRTKLYLKLQFIFSLATIYTFL